MTHPARLLRSAALTLAAAATFTLGTLSAHAQTASHPDSQKTPAASITPSANEAPEAQTWTNEQLIPLTVAEAWEMSGKSEDKFFDMVQQLAAFSAQKRGLTLPENAAAGQRAGQLIKRLAQTDRGQLLYVIVDQAVRRVATRTVAAK